MAKSNKHKLLHTGLIVIGIILFIIALWAIVVPHYTCKKGECQWSFIGTNYSCDTCHKQKSVAPKKSAALKKSAAPKPEPIKKVPEKEETIVSISQNPYPTQSESCYNNCSPFYDNDWRLYNTPYFYGTYSPYYRFISHPYHEPRRPHRQEIIKNINNNVFQIPNQPGPPPARPSPARPPPARPSPARPPPARPPPARPPPARPPSSGPPPSGPPPSGPPPSGPQPSGPSPSVSPSSVPPPSGPPSSVPPIGNMPSDKTDSFVQTF